MSARPSIRIDTTAPSDFLAWLFVSHDKRRAVDPVDGTVLVDTKPAIVRDASGKRVR